MTNVLTNNTNSSIILSLNKVSSPGTDIISMLPGESLLYDDIVVTNELDVDYNVPLIQEYIDAGILLNQQVTGIDQSTLQLLAQGNLVINLSTGIPKLISKATVDKIDNLQILPSHNTSGNLKYIYYKSIQGMSVSADFGVTQSLINNSNLLYPDEITSFAVQEFDSVEGVLYEVNRLYIGTLREGVKTFTPGIDLTYVDFEPTVSLDPTNPIFKTCLKETKTVNAYHNKTTNGIVAPDPAYAWPVQTTETTITFPEYGATYVLAIINSPYNSGCPIFIASRPRYTEVYTETTLTYTDGILTNTLIVPPVYIANNIYATKVVYKYLHSKIYVNSVLTSLVSYGSTGATASFSGNVMTLVSAPSTGDIEEGQIVRLLDGYGISFDTVILKLLSGTLNEAGSTYEIHTHASTPLPVRSITTLPIDWVVLYEEFLSYSAGVTFPEHIVDVITEYTPDGAICMIKHPSIEGECTNSLYKITCVLNATQHPVISLVGNPAQFYDFPFTGTIKNISYLAETDTGYSIFVTTNTTVWRFSSLTNEWEQFLYSANPISYLNTSVDNGILSSTGSTYLKELVNFVMFPKVNTTNSYIGILGTELGLVLYSLKLVNNDFITDSKTAKTMLYNVARGIMSDVKYTIYGENLYIFTSSYSSQIPRYWSSNLNCLQIINNDAALVSETHYLKPDVETTSDFPYYVSQDNLRTNHIPSSEQASYLPILIKSDYEYNLISPKYSFKLQGLSGDSVLVDALKSIIARKYYQPKIKERIISSVSPAELSTLEMHEFEHAFSMDYITSIATKNGFGLDSIPTGATINQISNQTSVTLSDTYDYNIGSFPAYPLDSWTAFTCVDLNNNIVLPIKIETLAVSATQYATTLSFSTLFSGVIYTNRIQPSPAHTDPRVYRDVVGFFATLTHSLGRYPQISLDSSVVGLLNDIKHIDTNRVEISFTSSVDTTVSFL